MRIFRKLAQMLDVDVTSTPPADGDSLTYDMASSKWVPEAVSGGGGGSDDQTAAEVPFTPAGTISATDTQSAIEEVASDAAAAVSALSTVYQPLDSDLTSVAALTTTSFGRGLLELANQAALLSAAGAAAASHAHAGEDITSGTVADARIASTIARDSEVTSAISTSEAGQVRDGDAAGGVLAGTYPNPSFASDMATQAELDAHVNDTSAAHAASAVSADSTTLVGTGTDVQAVLEELDNGIADHLADTTAAHAASAISFSATGTISGTDAQTAIAEVATDAASALSTHEADTTSVHGITDTSALYRAGGTDVALADGGTGASLVDPNADRILFWDDSAGAITFLAPGTNLTITNTTIDAASGGSSSADDVSLIVHMEVFA